MTVWLLFPLLGLAAGAIYAALAIGVILVHRGSAVVNLAQGAMAMFPAVVYVRLRETGELVLPVIGIPGKLDLGGPWQPLPAMAFAVLMGAAIGALAYLVVFRRLADAPAVTRLVASVGLTIVLQGAAVAQVGPSTRRADPLLPDGLVRVGGDAIPADRLWLVLIVVVIGGGVAVLYRCTTFGLATRGAAENAKGAILLGHSPVRLGLGNWLLASTIAALAGVLISQVSGVNPFNYSLFVVPALAAALAARLRSFGIAMATGIAIGMFEGLAVHLVARRQVPAFLLSGIESVVPFAVIVVALVVAGRSVPDRGMVFDPRHPPATRPRWRPAPTALAIGAAAALMTFGESQLRLAAITSMMVAIICASIVVLTGLLGQVSLAQLTLSGLGAFVLARASSAWGLPFPLAPLVALAATTAFGVLISLPGLRIRGIQFAIVTLTAAVATEQLLFRNPSFTGTGGTAHVDAPSVAGHRFGIIGPGEYPYRPFGLVVLGVLVATVALVSNARRSAFGRRLLAVRANERAAAASGVAVARSKLEAAALASFLAGLAGVVFAYKNVDFSWSGLEASRGLQLLALAYLGGVASVGGALIAGLLAPSGLLLVALGSPPAAGRELLLSGVGLLVVTVRFPGGIAGAGPWLRRRVHASRRRTPTVGQEEIEVVALTPARQR